SSRPRSTAHGTRPRNVSAPSSSGNPPCRAVLILPPARSSASSTTASMPRCCRCHAVDSPAIPAPTTTTRRESDTCPYSTRDRFAQTGVVVERLRTGEGQAQLARAGSRLDVEVVEDLEVVGRETGRAHEHAVDLAGGGQF